MLSGKQKRALILARRKEKAERARAAPVEPAPWLTERPKNTVRVDYEALRPFNSWDPPDFVQRGYYQAVTFACRDCGARQLWTAEDQQWWYETAKGYVYSTAVRCLGCRRERRLAPHRKKSER